MTNFTAMEGTDGEVGSHVGGTNNGCFEYAIGLETGSNLSCWLLWSLPTIYGTSPIIDVSIELEARG